MCEKIDAYVHDLREIKEIICRYARENQVDLVLCIGEYNSEDEYDQFCILLDSDDLAAIDRATAASLRRQPAAQSKNAHLPAEDSEFDEYFISLGSEDYAIVDSATAAPH
ncbi:hypothetical protein OIV83_006516 [Microbotryomycetes sp. JL201]|nr:hypothetical protein OIV83_006516 [Microbotryomycetes sp. JL201]